MQKIFTQLVGAVTYVHNKSCVHRDLKLENILLDKHENVKLCDFGFTREYEGKASYLQTSCGTVCYAAPEMLKGEKYAGEKVDVWSLGVILYALLTGELPFDEDDDGATRAKIFSCEPKYPDHLPSDAKGLIGLLLSKRPLLRPSLSDILAHPFLSEHAPQQQAILKLQQPAPFSTKLEKDTLERMHSAGVDIDKVIENVLAQRCDCLAGWWALLIEKEERKEARRERKRRQKEAEARSLRRLSAASVRMERMGPTIREIDEQGGQTPIVGDPPRSRGRREARNSSAGTCSPIHSPIDGGALLLTLACPSGLGAFELPQLPEIAALDSSESAPPPPPIDKDSIRSVSSSRQRPPLPPKEPSRRTRTSAMQLVASANPDLLSPTTIRKRRRSRWHYYPIMNQLNQVKDWLAKRAKSPGSKSLPSAGTSPNGKSKAGSNVVEPVLDGQASSTAKLALQPANSKTFSNLPPGRVSNNSHRRTSLSPAPVTPHASFRRSSTGLRGRKSTSSSVSSVRSIRHRHSHSHSKASSASSNSLNSPATKAARSPRNSVKVLPATPTAVSFPSNIRVVRGASHNNNYNETASFGLHSPGLTFAKRKRRPLKGPMLSIGTGGGGAGPSTRRENSASRSASAAGRHSGEIIEEEDEEDDVEEVDAFSPIVGPGEIEVTIDGPAGQSSTEDLSPPPPPLTSEELRAVTRMAEARPSTPS